MNDLHEYDTPRDHGLWSYISASRLNLWIKCPLAFRFRYIDGIKSPPNVNLFLGKVVHAALETYYRQRQLDVTPTAEDAETLTNTAWNETEQSEPMGWDSSDDAAKANSQSVSLVQAYIAEYTTKSERIIAMESNLETPCVDPATGEDFDIPLYGVIDLVLQEDHVPLVVDFKTAASASMICDQSHSVQLTTYTLLMQGNGYERVETEIRQLVKNKAPKICAYRFGERSDRDYEKFFALCREYLDSLDRGVFNYRPCWNCGMCDYRGLCNV